jgi:hypothetical protein
MLKAYRSSPPFKLKEADINMKEEDINMKEEDINMKEEDINMKEEDINMKEEDINMKGSLSRQQYVASVMNNSLLQVEKPENMLTIHYFYETFAYFPPANQL